MTKKPDNISDDEKRHFRDAIEGTKPLKHDKLDITGQKKKPAARTREPEYTAPLHRSTPLSRMYEHDTEHWAGGDDSLYYERNGLQKRLIQQMKRGQIPLEARLDLHGMTVDEALCATDHFLQRCNHERLRWACLIHGKGQYSDSSKPILKNMVAEALRQHPLVLAYCSAQPKHGGTGAVYILIKSKGMT